ncbi:hypothetical protein GXW71_03545 [Roseomonas hellenica]|uniref:Uncharacterized protein n=1 Tax=Plastoroseomonas hellenica TaxID=2687306 RepID=A0ABS5ESZ4_9PROT|nr:hypothetical protein [Plastoroseomonas hellenica]MBR0663423.1 hypothetical protein [Plastoroseomonas hellenica]
MNPLASGNRDADGLPPAPPSGFRIGFPLRAITPPGKGDKSSPQEG